MLGIDRLNDIVLHYEELMNTLGEPDVASDTGRFQKLMREQAELEPIVRVFHQHEKAASDQKDALEMLEHESDPDMREMLKNELSDARRVIEETERELQILLLPKDPNDSKNIIMEIRAGVGGDESALFAADLYRMYSNYAARQGWRTELASCNENGIGGFKEITFVVDGQGAYQRVNVVVQ